MLPLCCSSRRNSEKVGWWMTPRWRVSGEGLPQPQLFGFKGVTRGKFVEISYRRCKICAIWWHRVTESGTENARFSITLLEVTQNSPLLPYTVLWPLLSCPKCNINTSIILCQWILLVECTTHQPHLVQQLLLLLLLLLILKDLLFLVHW